VSKVSIRTLSLLFFLLNSAVILAIVLSIIKWKEATLQTHNFHIEHKRNLEFLEVVTKISERRTLSLQAFAISKCENCKIEYEKLENGGISFFKTIPNESSKIWRIFNKIQELERSAFYLITSRGEREVATNIIFSKEYYQLKYNLTFYIEKQRKKFETLSKRVEESSRIKRLEYITTSLLITLFLSNMTIFIFFVRRENLIIENILN
jgi:hypothetical protein